jgi:streptogramin lyase
MSVFGKAGRRGRNRDRNRTTRPGVELFEERTLLSTFTVTNNTDVGPGSLRQAISDSNASPAGTNTINFNIAVGSIAETAALAPAGSTPQGIATGPDGNIYFTENSGDRVGVFNFTTGLITYITLAAGSNPVGITAGPSGDNHLWFTEAVTYKIL